MNWKKFPFSMLITMLYVALGTLFNAWNSAWLLYLTIPLYYAILRAIKSEAKNKQADKAAQSDDWSRF